MSKRTQYDLTTDFDTWLAENGPENIKDLSDLESVISGQPSVGHYTGKVSHNGSGWHIQRDDLTRLNLSSKSRRAFFKQRLWYYRAGKSAWHRHPERPKPKPQRKNAIAEWIEEQEALEILFS